MFLLDDGDLARVRRLLLPRPTPEAAAASPAGPYPGEAREPNAAVRGVDRAAARVGVAVYLALSLASAAFVFGDGEPGPLLASLTPVVERAETLRLVNTYHLFASITRERIEPEFQTLAPGADEDEDTAWTAHDLRHKPGAATRAPDFVAPHQPRLDFQLWFHGLAFRRGEPPYVRMLLERMCEDSDAVRSFFRDSSRDPLPPHPRAVRVVYWQYHFTTPAEKHATGAWWRRERLAAMAPVQCAGST